MKISITEFKTAAICLILLFFVYCYDFESIVQPDIADPNSVFDVEITVSLTSDHGGIPHFGILLPNGWAVNDSIQYTGTLSGTFIYSSSISDSIEHYEPAPAGYYWWVAVGDTVDSLYAGSVSFSPQIQTNNQSGTFFIDYIMGHSSGTPLTFYPIDIRSGGYPISVNAPMTITVTNNNNDGPGSLRQALSEISSSGEIFFNLSYPDTILLDSQLVIDRNLTISGPQAGELTISGNDTCGIFFIKAHRAVDISNIIISNGYGGGINTGAVNNRDLNNGNINLNNVTIRNCWAEGYGGALYTVAFNVTLINVEITNNFGGGGGGGIYFFEGGCSLSIINSIIQNNSTTTNDTYWGDGGGIYCAPYGNPILNLTNVLIAENSASRGGGIRCSKGHFINVTFANNSASFDGDDIFVSGNGIQCMVNTIVWNNPPSNIYLGGSLDAFYSNIQGGWTGPGNINSDPMFVDTANGDYHLLRGSPCIDAGIQNTILYYNNGQDTLVVPPMNYNNAGPDMGAFEFGPPLALNEDHNRPQV